MAEGKVIVKRDFKLGMSVALIVGTVVFALNQSVTNGLMGAAFLLLFLGVIWLSRDSKQLWLGLGVLLMVGVVAQHLLDIQTRVPRVLQLFAVPLVAYFFWLGLSGIQQDEYLFKLQDQGKLWGLIVGLFVSLLALNLSPNGSPVYWMSLGAMLCGLVTLLGGYFWSWWSLRS